jgi:hypothetical protein
MARARNAGTIEKRGDNCWLVRLYIGTDPMGHRRYLS